MELFDDDLDRLEDGIASAFRARAGVLAETGIKRIVNGAISFAPGRTADDRPACRVCPDSSSPADFSGVLHRPAVSGSR